jgi:hypothetical protein
MLRPISGLTWRSHVDIPPVVSFMCVVTNDQKRERRRDELEVEGGDDFGAACKTCSFSVSVIPLI